MNFLFRVAEKVEQVQEDLGSVERIFDAAIQRHFQGKPTSIEQVGLFVEQEIARSPERTELGQTAARDIADLTRRAKELLESTDNRLGISPQALHEILRAAITVEGGGALEEITGTRVLPSYTFPLKLSHFRAALALRRPWMRLRTRLRTVWK